MMLVALSVYPETGYRSFYFTEVTQWATESKKAKKKLGIFKNIIKNETN